MYLGFKGFHQFSGQSNPNFPKCGVASNSTASNAFDFTGNGGINVNAPSFSAGGCSQTGGNQCNNVTNMRQPVPNPLSGLDSAMSSLTTSNFSGTPKSDGPYASYESCNCYNDTTR